MGKVIYLTDRSACEKDDYCGMAYWWNRLHNNIGMIPAGEIEALRVGGEIHEDLSNIAESDGTEESVRDLVATTLSIAGPETSQRDRELLYRRAGWIAGFGLFIEPRIRAKWDTVQVEGELILDRTPLWIPVTPDRVLQNKEKPHIYKYLEYKSTISASNKWVNSWTTRIQLHLGLKALEEEAGINATYAQVMGLMKGEERDGRLHHPYVWGYYNSNTEEWTHEYSKARSAAWGPRPTWEFPGGLVEWVKLCGEDVANAQFPHSPPVHLDERMLDLWVVRKIARMKQVDLVKDLCAIDEKARVCYFEPRTDRCKPAFGNPCEYLAACWNASINQDPLKNGMYVPRVPHHEIERIMRKDNGS